MGLLLNLLNIIIQIGNCLLDRIDAFSYFSSCEILWLPTFYVRLWSIFILLIIFAFLESCIWSVLQRRYHCKETFAPAVVTSRSWTCLFLMSWSVGRRGIVKFYLFRGDCLSRCLSKSVRFICSILAQISGNRELIIDIFLNLSFGIGATLVGLIDSLF